MSRRFERALDSAWILCAACAISLLLGLFFIFVWAPHPWGWEGFDHYHDIAIELAHGRPFPTMEVPWGYAYFLAAFYRAFGVHPWIPLIVQSALNALTPLLLFVLARTWGERRIAALAALLTGLFSFNTIYASTESSDAVCTVIFLAAIVAFTRARGGRSFAWFAVAGVLAGVAPQFRPNLILAPALLAGYAIWTTRTRQALAQALLLLVCAGAVLAPWVIRNYRLTGMMLPTSVHGGVRGGAR
jgi:4-amino-4-deoxy-L-arabinose transferase-like glycosyltransferase